jgi:type I restriction enzyme M protein
LGLSPNQRKKLIDPKVWQGQLEILKYAQALHKKIGDELYTDFNEFVELIKDSLKTDDIKLKANELKQILDAVSWYDETGAKVIKSVMTLKQDKLEQLLARLDCTQADLLNFGYYPASEEGIAKAKPNQYVIYESNSDLRDSESIPLDQRIHDYYLAEVKPHVNEAWIDLDSVKIGYEISFNKYFYQHKPLRALDEVASELVKLEQQADGLIAQILGSAKLNELVEQDNANQPTS